MAYSKYLQAEERERAEKKEREERAAEERKKIEEQKVSFIVQTVDGKVLLIVENISKQSHIKCIFLYFSVIVIY